MREINVQQITDVVERLCIEANTHLPSDVKCAIRDCRACEDWDIAKGVLDNIITNFEIAKLNFVRHGYKLPKVVFWNVQSRNTQQPVTMNEQGVALVSGCTPRLFSMVMEGDIDPYHFMMEVIGNERYAKIAA